MKHLLLDAVLVLSVAYRAFAGESASASTIYDPDPNHLWNRLNATLFARSAPDGKQFGLDELDILYWRSTRNLLTEPSHQKALAVLDEFIHTNAENLVRDPLKRAWLQRDLWELFDWSAKGFRPPDEMRACGELQVRLATIIRRLAITTNEIAALPNNYVHAETRAMLNLPKDLLLTNGDWVSVGLGDYSEEPVAPTHAMSFNGHSAFSVMLRVPGGRQAALGYLEKLRRFKQHERVWVYQTNRFTRVSTNEPAEAMELNPTVPQFKPGTEWALVRQMCLIASDRRIHPTPVTESIQLRRYLKPDRAVPDTRFATNNVQEFFEFQMDKRQDGILRALGRDEKGFAFVHFMGKGIDLFEGTFRRASGKTEPSDSATLQSPLLHHCYQCHSAPGIFSVNSYMFFGQPASPRYPPDLASVEMARQATVTMYWKQRQYDWGLLQGIWLQQP